MTTRRKDIQTLIGQGFRPSTPNASLWLDKFIYDSRKPTPNLPETKNYGKSETSISDNSKKDETAKVELIRRVTSIAEPEIYKDYFENTWHSQLHNFGAKRRKAKVKNRLAINLGSESVLETNISLHRVFGVPFIAGSSLKGMTAAFIRQYGDWNKDKDKDEYNYYITVFGDENNAGFITFYDALYVPNTGFPDKDGVKRPLYTDVMTVHHQEYYGGGNVPPADWDSPNPVPFISATGEYMIALSAPEGCEDWITLTFDILGFALATEGIGAKTSSGYGRMWLLKENGEIDEKYELKATVQESSNPTESPTNSAPPKVVSEQERIAKNLIQRINALRNNDVANQIKNFADECFVLEDEAAKKEIAKVIITKVEEAGRTKKSMEKPWFQKVIKLGDGAEWVVEVK